MSDLIPIKDNMGLLRDPKTNSIINVNKSQYNNYMRLKEQKESERKNYNTLEEEVLKMKDDINEIKSMLKMIINQ
jgi:predicted  nucleic acid-binding Zn-ribbon protein